MFTDLLNSLDVNRLAYQDMPNIRKIELMEWYLKNRCDHTHAREEYRVDHYFKSGYYIRALHIPAGQLLIGELHKQTHYDYLAKGLFYIMSNDGVYMREAPFFSKNPPGVKKMGYAYTDVIYCNIHKTDKTDIDEIEKEMVVNSDLSWIEGLLCHG